MKNELARRERQLLEASCAGLSRGEIAYEWGVSPKTVTTTATRSVEKMNANNFTHACVLYTRKKLDEQQRARKEIDNDN